MPARDPRGGCLAARCIWLAPGAALAPGLIRWDGAGRVVELRPARGRVADLCVLPGLVDAHTHLQIEPLVGANVPREFVRWARAVMAARAEASPAARRAALGANLAVAVAGGVTAVGEIDSTGSSPPLLRAAGVGGRCYQEVVGYHLDVRGASELIGRRARPSDARLAAGLSPHAPYSVSPSLFRVAARRDRRLAIHCAETPEEQEFLRSGRGPFAELLRSLGRLPAGHRPPGVGAVAWLERLGLLRRTTQLVHCQELEPDDVGRIAGAGSPIVVCPGTIEWFGRSAPPVAAWLRAGIRVALGSDSPASAAPWSPRAWLSKAARLWPELSPEVILAMATRSGGAALALPGRGRLCLGGRADLIGVPMCGSGPADAVESFVHGETGVGVVLAGGRALVGAEVGVEP